MTIIVVLLAGSLYGLLMGIIPVAGASIALIAVYPLLSIFLDDPYLGVMFIMSMCAGTSIGDSFSSVLLGIPGAGSTAACIFDGYPMTKNGEAGRAIGIILFDSALSGIFFAIVGFLFIPIYGKLILHFFIPDFLALMILGLSCVGFLISKDIYKSLFAICVGGSIGLIGMDPSTTEFRYTFGIDYLKSGVSFVAVISGLFAIPELVEGFLLKKSPAPRITNYYQQLLIGVNDVLTHWRDAIRGSFIGFFIGIIPGVGGGIADFIAYGVTSNIKKKNEKEFGAGNPRGLIGIEGANNANNVGAMIPTILFGVPGGPWAAIVMGVLMYFGMNMGSQDTLSDSQFINSLFLGYIFGTLFVAILSVFIVRLIIKLLEVPFYVYGIIIFLLVVWANFQYTGGIEDIIVLFIMSIIGLIFKYLHINRPAALLSFVVMSQLEKYASQTFTIYSFKDLLHMPLFLILTLTSLLIITLCLYRTHTEKFNNENTTSRNIF